MIEIWNSEWTEYTGARQTKQFFPSTCPSITKKIISLPRNDVSRLVRLVTGHNNQNYHASLRDGETDPMCRYCESQWETFFHFITECPCMLSLRADIFKSFGGPTLCDGDWSVDDVLKFSYMPAVEEAYNAFMYHYGSEDEDEDT